MLLGEGFREAGGARGDRSRRRTQVSTGEASPVKTGSKRGTKRAKLEYIVPEVAWTVTSGWLPSCQCRQSPHTICLSGMPHPREGNQCQKPRYEIKLQKVCNDFG